MLAAGAVGAEEEALVAGAEGDQSAGFQRKRGVNRQRETIGRACFRWLLPDHLGRGEGKRLPPVAVEPRPLLGNKGEGVDAEDLARGRIKLEQQRPAGEGRPAALDCDGGDRRVEPEKLVGRSLDEQPHEVARAQRVGRGGAHG